VSGLPVVSPVWFLTSHVWQPRRGTRVAEQFEPFGTFEDTGYHHRLDLDSPFGGLISPAANRNVDAPVTDGPKGFFPKGRRVEQRVGTIGQLPADRLGEAWSALDHDIRAVAAYQLGICCVGVGDGFKRFDNAVVTISGIELAEKIKKGQFKKGRLGGCNATMTELWNAALVA
jgi:hypothetical protein